jgi:hypothetical protein
MKASEYDCEQPHRADSISKELQSSWDDRESNGTMRTTESSHARLARTAGSCSPVDDDDHRR